MHNKYQPCIGYWQMSLFVYIFIYALIYLFFFFYFFFITLFLFENGASIQRLKSHLNIIVSTFYNSIIIIETTTYMLYIIIYLI